MLSIFCLSRFGTKCQRRQHYDSHIRPSISTVGATSVSVFICRRGAGYRDFRASYDYMVTVVIVAWIGNGDDFCSIEVEELGERISRYSRVVFWRVYTVSTRGTAITTTKSGSFPLGCNDVPFVCVVILELLRLWERVWKCSLYQVLSRRNCRTHNQRSLLCHSVCCGWIDLIERTTQDHSPTSSILNNRLDNA